MTSMPEIEFPPGTPVRVIARTARRGEPIETQTIGVVESWEEMPTGSWHAHGLNDRLWLRRLQLRKVDGEQSLLVVDDGTHIARIEPETA